LLGDRATIGLVHKLMQNFMHDIPKLGFLVHSESLH